MTIVELGAFLDETSVLAEGDTQDRELAVLDPDGSRQIVAREVLLGSNMDFTIEDRQERWPNNPVLIWGPTGDGNVTVGVGKYCPYIPADNTDLDPPTVVDPVNQIPYLLKWRPVVARILHEWDITNGMKSLTAITDNEREAISTWVQVACGYMWWYIDQFAARNPVTESWKGFIEPIGDKMTRLCEVCGTSNFVRRIARNANLSLLRSEVTAGRIKGFDMNLTPWGQGRVIEQVLAGIGQTPSTAQIERFYERNINYAASVLDYYDEHVGHDFDADESPHNV